MNLQEPERSGPSAGFVVATMFGLVLAGVVVMLVRENDPEPVPSHSTRECVHYDNGCIICVSEAGRDVYSPEACKELGK